MSYAYSVLAVMYRQAHIQQGKFPDNVKPELHIVAQSRHEINANPENYFSFCKKFAPTEELPKDLTEAMKRTKLVLYLGNPASAITWLHKCLRAILVQRSRDSFTSDRAQELMTYWRKHPIMEQIDLSKKTNNKLQAAIFRDAKPPTKMVDIVMRVEGGLSACLNAYSKADAFGLFNSKQDQTTNQ